MSARSRANSSVGLFVALSLFALVAAFAALALAPASAAAKSYEMSRVNIEATITDAGDVHFVEQRQFDFDGGFTCVWWTLGSLPRNASVQVNGVSLFKGSYDDYAAGAALSIGEVPFEDTWRVAGGPGGDAYSWDEVERSLYVFFHARDESLTVTIDYTIVNGISAYDDIAEFYWQYITRGWEVDSENVSATISLPVPQGEQVIPTENVYAWGHGPLDGSVHFNDDGTVSYQVNRVPAGSYAEARILFPVSWMPQLSDSSRELHAGSSLLSSALAEEQAWADEANAKRMRSWLLVIACVGICLAILVWAIVMFVRYGKELRPEFTERYWRDVPDKELPPAVIGRLMKWNAEDPNQFTATLMNLSHKGVIRIDKGSYLDKRGKAVEDYYLTLVSDQLDFATLDVLEKRAIDFIFGKIGKHKDSLWLKSIELYGKENAESFLKQMEYWHGALSAEVSKAGLFEPKSDSLQSTMRFMAVGLFALSIFFSLVIVENLIPLVPAGITSVLLLIIGHFMSKRTHRGNELAAKSEALKNWLRDFTRLDERPPTDVQVWGQFMVYAYLFGVAEQVVKDLRLHIPTFQAMDDSTFYTTMPYYYWYSSDFGHANVIAATAFNATLSNTLSTAIDIVSEVSSGSGGGGGFSIGGGGGFGGGGGGGAR